MMVIYESQEGIKFLGGACPDHEDVVYKTPPGEWFGGMSFVQ
jgi:hypothetical protein